MATTSSTTPTTSHPSPETLIEAGHDATTLVETAIQHINRPYHEWDEDRQKALEDWTTWSTTALSFSCLSRGILPTDQAMWDLISILDRLFFKRTVATKCSFDWTEGLLAKNGSLGETRRHRGDVGIEMDPSLGVKNKIMEPKQKLLDKILSTLVHEMTHVYIELYACQGECGRPECQPSHQRYIESIGEKGHARCWQVLAEALERQSKVYLLKGIDLGRWGNAVLEYIHSGYMMGDEDVRNLLDGNAPTNDKVEEARRKEVERQRAQDE